MHLGKEAMCVAAGLALCVLVGGCIGRVSSPLAPPLDARGVDPRRPLTPAAPDLRISGETLAAAQEIPLVPLPIPPNERPPVPVTPGANPKTAPAPMPPASDPAPPARPMPPGPGAATSPPATGIENVRRLVKLAAARYDGMDSYIARLTRREQVNGDNKPQEVLLFKFRKEPWSVYFKWLGDNGAGREVIYVKGQYENKIHTLLAAGDMPFAPAGKRMALAPDSILVRSASRHPITEAGLGASIERLRRLLDARDRGDQRFGTLNDLGTIPRPEFAQPVAAIEHVVPAGQEADLPRGGRRTYCFDSENHLPVLLITRDHRGQEVEYYFYDRLQFPVRLDDNDFNPDKVWAKPRGRP